MSFIKQILRQRLVHWPKGGLDEFGRPTFDEPEEIQCRWDDVAEEFLDPEGVKQVSRSKILLGQEVGVGGLLRLGVIEEIEESDFPEDPKEDEDVVTIRSVSRSPTLKATNSIWVVMV